MRSTQQSASLFRNWKLWVGIAVSAVALYLTFRDIRLDEFFQQLTRANVVWLAPALSSVMVTLLLRAWRWSVLMDGTPFTLTFHAQNIGYLLNMTLPLRLGEVGRAFVIGERTTVSMARALSSVVVERMLDLAAVVLLFVLFAQFIPMPPSFAQAAALGGLFVAALVAAIGVLIWQAPLVERVLLRIGERFPRIKADRLLRIFRDVCAGFKAINTRRKFGLVFVTTALVWATNLLTAYWMMFAFMPGQWDQAGLVLVMANLGGALPSAPGGIGVVQGLARESLVIPFGVDKNIAVAYAFVWSLSQQLMLIILGLIGLARVGLSFTRIATRVADRSQQAK